MPIDISLIKSSLGQFGARRENIRRRFYELLCDENPLLDSELSDEDKGSLREVFDEGMATIISQFENPDQLEASLVKLGDKYRGDWMRPEYTSYFKDAFMSALEEEMGSEWPRSTYDAWDEVIEMGLLIIQRSWEITPVRSDA